MAKPYEHMYTVKIAVTDNNGSDLEITWVRIKEGNKSCIGNISNNGI